MFDKILSDANLTSKSIQENEAAILTVCGVLGFLGAIVLTGIKTPKAVKKATEAKEKLLEKKPEASKTSIIFEEVKAAGPSYVGVALIAIGSSYVIFKSDSIQAKKISMYATAYELTREGFKEYREKTKELVGEKKEKEIRDEVIQEQINKNEAPSGDLLVDDGLMLCYDTIGGRYFKSTPEKLRKIESILNRRLYCEDWISLNEFYYEADMDRSEAGDVLGWNIGEEIDLVFGSQLAKDGCTPCLSVSFNVGPRLDFRELR